jgi:hypothetical protein
VLQLGAFFLPAVPLLVLLVALLLGRYPGHEAIVRLSDRIAAARRPQRAAGALRSPLRPPTRAASGGLLLALALSGRAPPASPSS